MCLGSVVKVASAVIGTRVVVVDADSRDGTRTLAASFPVEVYRYTGPVRTAAANRRIGIDLLDAEYVLCVDGDSRIEPDWVAAAMARMEREPRLAMLCGRRRDVYEPGGDEAEDIGFGGTALYRRAALRAVGGFHPYLAAEEEAELLGRLRAAGYDAALTPDLMITHYTLRKETWRGATRRWARGMMLGAGQVLRVASRTGHFWYHARRLNRALLTLGYLVMGAAVSAAVLCGAPGWLALAWLAAGAAAAALLAYRHGIQGAAHILLDWVSGAVGIAAGLFRTVPDPRSFQPHVEAIASPSLSSQQRAGDASRAMA